MIHHVFIIDARDEIVVKWRYERLTIDIDPVTILSFAARVRESPIPIIEEIGTIKFAGGQIRRGVVVLCAEGIDTDNILDTKVREVTAEFESVIKYEVDYEDFMERLQDYIAIPLKIALVGKGRVGKTTFATLLSGGTPPTKYNPTVAFGLFQLKGIRYGTYQIVLWDLAGQDIFLKLYSLYLRDTRIVFLITDSTLANVLETKELVDFIHREKLDVKMKVIANKQDLQGAIPPNLIYRILGIETESMVAIDINNRKKAEDIIKNALAELDDKTDEKKDYDVDLK